jgi:hypothetical protein
MSLADLNQPEPSRGQVFLKQSANIYTMLLILSFLAVAIGCLFMFLEMKSYDLHVTVPPDAKAPQAQVAPPHTQSLAEASVPELNCVHQRLSAFS